MSTNAQKRKQAKVKARQVAVQKKKHQERVAIAQALSHHKNDIVGQVAREGTLSLAERLHHTKHKVDTAPQELTVKEVLTAINEAVPLIAMIHGGVEVFNILAKEGKVEITEENKAIIDEYDEQMVKTSENVNAMISMIEAGKQPSDFMGIFIHYLDLIAQMLQESIPKIRQTIFTQNEQLIEEYSKEHLAAEENYLQQGLRFHELRMKEVAPLYRTKLPVIDDLEPMEPISDSIEETPIVSSGIGAASPNTPIVVAKPVEPTYSA